MSNLTDVVGGANMYGGISYEYTYDRFCNAYSAIYFNVGYLQVPSGVYFSGDFTITAWMYLLSNSASRMIDFGNLLSDNILLGIDFPSLRVLGLVRNSTSGNTFVTPSLMQLKTWYHVAFVLSGSIGYIYVNGNLTVSAIQNFPNNVIRNNNYVGKSNWASNTNANATYDDLKIYNGSLSAAQILNDYITSSSNGLS